MFYPVGLHNFIDRRYRTDTHTIIGRRYRTDRIWSYQLFRWLIALIAASSQQPR